jgi:phage shock protein C
VRVARRLTRDEQHKVIGGVAAGFGRYLDVDPVLVRLAFVLLAFMNGLGLLIYLAAWVLMPKAQPELAAEGLPAEGPPPAGAAVVDQVRAAGAEVAARARSVAADPSGARLAIGGALVVLGSVLLLDELGLLRWPHWARLEVLWPTLLIALGVGLIFRSRREATS